MTSAFSSYGQGADARQPLGLAVVGGMVVSQFLTLNITPVICLYLDRLQGGGSKAEVAVEQPVLATAGANSSLG